MLLFFCRDTTFYIKKNNRDCVINLRTVQAIFLTVGPIKNPLSTKGLRRNLDIEILVRDNIMLLFSHNVVNIATFRTQEKTRKYDRVKV